MTKVKDETAWTLSCNHTGFCILLSWDFGKVEHGRERRSKRDTYHWEAGVFFLYIGHGVGHTIDGIRQDTATSAV